MRKLALAASVAALIFSGMTVLADDTPVTQPAPVAPAADVVPAPTTVVVLPFKQIGSIDSNYDWLGRAIQQNLLAELSRTQRPLQPVTAVDDAPVFNSKLAVEAAKSTSDAAYVVFGTFQVFDQNLRLTGQVVDVATGKVTGSLKSTGTVRDLFAMEDTISTQAKRLLSPPPKPVAAANHNLPLAIPATQPTAARTAPAQQPPRMPAVQNPANRYATNYNTYVYYPSQAPYYPNYGYGYGSPYGYGYGYGGYGWGYNAVGFTSVTRTVHTPRFIGSSMSNSATGMLSVSGNFRPNGELAK